MEDACDSGPRAARSDLIEPQLGAHTRDTETRGAAINSRYAAITLQWTNKIFIPPFSLTYKGQK